MTERIGVYICECGPNIGEALHMDRLVRKVRDIDGVDAVRVVGLLCSEEGRSAASRDIRNRHLSRVVFAGCSPKEHESTFRSIMEDAGCNPFLMQVANIREQCAWVDDDRDSATRKAGTLIRAAVQRVARHEPLTVSTVPCLTDVLVVGAGVAGMSAALTLAQEDRKVHLVERQPWIGGKTVRYEALYPDMQCASCVLDPMMDEVLHHPRIEMFTRSEIREVLGFFGNFIIKAVQRPGYVDGAACIGCGACMEVCPCSAADAFNEGLDRRTAIHIPYGGALPNVAAIDSVICRRFSGEPCRACRDACPFGAVDFDETERCHEFRVGAVVLATGFDLFDPGRMNRYGYERIPDVYTGLEFERILNADGPSNGEIRCRDGSPPERIALVHCVGSRDITHHTHCPGICCMISLKFAHQICQKLPDIPVHEFYADFCLPGKRAQNFFNETQGADNLRLHRLRMPGSIRVAECEAGISVRYTDTTGQTREIIVDMVVLAPAFRGSAGVRQLAAAFDIPVDDHGFFVEDDPLLAPVQTSRDGILISGCAKGPADISGSVTQGQAAAGIILRQLVPGTERTVEPMTAAVAESLCTGCGICIGVCPYKAIDMEKARTPGSSGTSDHSRAAVNPLLCRGCGTCAASCPSGAMEARHFTDSAISAEINGLLKCKP